MDAGLGAHPPPPAHPSPPPAGAPSAPPSPRAIHPRHHGAEVPPPPPPTLHQRRHGADATQPTPPVAAPRHGTGTSPQACLPRLSASSAAAAIVAIPPGRLLLCGPPPRRRAPFLITAANVSTTVRSSPRPVRATNLCRHAHPFILSCPARLLLLLPRPYGYDASARTCLFQRRGGGRPRVYAPIFRLPPRWPVGYGACTRLTPQAESRLPFPQPVGELRAPFFKPALSPTSAAPDMGSPLPPSPPRRTHPMRLVRQRTHRPLHHVRATCGVRS